MGINESGKEKVLRKLDKILDEVAEGLADGSMNIN